MKFRLAQAMLLATTALVMNPVAVYSAQSRTAQAALSPEKAQQIKASWQSFRTAFKNKSGREHDLFERLDSELTSALISADIEITDANKNDLILRTTGEKIDFISLRKELTARPNGRDEISALIDKLAPDIKARRGGSASGVSSSAASASSENEDILSLRMRAFWFLQDAAEENAALNKLKSALELVVSGARGFDLTKTEDLQKILPKEENLKQWQDAVQKYKLTDYIRELQAKKIGSAPVVWQNDLA